MEVVKESKTVKRRSKGEQSRNNILDAAIMLLAEHGIKGTTHRAIANHSGLQLSLTTYYFKDINELIFHAFKRNSELTIEKAATAWQDAFQLLAKLEKDQPLSNSDKTDIQDHLTALAVDYIVQKVETQPTMLAVERLLFSLTNSTSHFTELAKFHRTALLKPFEQLCAAFNPATSEVDADIMFTVFTQLEYRNIGNSGDEIDKAEIHSRVHRIVEWVMKAP